MTKRTGSFKMLSLRFAFVSPVFMGGLHFPGTQTGCAICFCNEVVWMTCVLLDKSFKSHHKILLSLFSCLFRSLNIYRLRLFL